MVKNKTTINQKKKKTPQKFQKQNTYMRKMVQEKKYQDALVTPGRFTMITSMHVQLFATLGYNWEPLSTCNDFTTVLFSQTCSLKTTFSTFIPLFPSVSLHTCLSPCQILQSFKSFIFSQNLPFPVFMFFFQIPSHRLSFQQPLAIIFNNLKSDDVTSCLTQLHDFLLPKDKVQHLYKFQKCPFYLPPYLSSLCCCTHCCSQNDAFFSIPLSCPALSCLLPFWF